MASVSTDAKGYKRVLFCVGDDRKAVRLGKVSKEQANKFKEMIEDILASKRTGRTSKGTDEWLYKLDDEMHGRLAAVGLVKSRTGDGNALGKFIDAYLASRTDAKPQTIRNLKHCRADLVAFFGEDKPIRDITEGDAEKFWRYLQSDTRKGGALAVNTARGICKGAKTFFNFAVKSEFMETSPFQMAVKMKGSAKERRFTITRAMADKVLDACPNIEWKLIFALSRYGGLRCPSEHLRLKWTDINWEHGRILVHSPKTEHHEGGDSRLIPLFPELEPLLLEAQETAEEGAEYVITRYRGTNSSMRTQMRLIIKRAGLKPWPKTFHNLRATRETELMEKHAAHVVHAWIGNSPAVSAEHYLEVTDAHFDQARNKPQEAAQNPAQSGRVLSGNAGNLKKNGSEKVAVLPEKSQQNPKALNSKSPLRGGGSSGGWPAESLRPHPVISSVVPLPTPFLPVPSLTAQG